MFCDSLEKESVASTSSNSTSVEKSHDSTMVSGTNANAMHESEAPLSLKTRMPIVQATWTLYTLMMMFPLK